MVFKIRTSKKTEEMFAAIEASENLQPYALSKLAISLSLKSNEPLNEEDFATDSNGLELNRQTITGEYDELYKCLVVMRENRHIEDSEYFQRYIKAHLDRGAKYLYSEFRYGGDFITRLLSGDNGL
jgi:DNA sulfur modification protein DndE